MWVFTQGFPRISRGRGLSRLASKRLGARTEMSELFPTQKAAEPFL